MRSLAVFSILLLLKTLSRIFYRCEAEWIGAPRPQPWHDLKLVSFLNHTSLYEPLFTSITPNAFLWRLARHGVIPAADKTIQRPFVGKLFRFIARHVVAITRERDQTWFKVLQTIDPDSMVIILPEGRMMRANGLDANGQPMTVRGGIADILDAVGSGKMLFAYSGGLHHVQVPGETFPRLFKTIRIRFEVVEIEEYVQGLKSGNDADGFKKAVREDLERRRDRHCPIELP